MRLARQLNLDCVAGANLAPVLDDAHYAGLAPNLLAVQPVRSPVGGQRRIRRGGDAVRALDHHFEQPGPEVVDLAARIAQSGEADDNLADTEPGSDRQVEQRYALGCDVLPQIARRQPVTALGRFGEQLGVDEVDLTKVLLIGVSPDAGAVLDQRARVRVSGDSESRNQGDRELRP